MINVVITKDKYFKKVVLKGHAMFSEYGTDIVCASISSITTFAINACSEFDDSFEFKIDEELGYSELIVNKYVESIDTVLKVLEFMLLDLESQYPEYIKVNNGGESYD